MESNIEDEDTRRNFLEVIDDETERMTRLVKELLQLSRLDNNREKLNLKELDVNSLLSDCAKKVMLTAQAKQQRVECLFDDDIQLHIFADRDRIQQVILNVLSNWSSSSNQARPMAPNGTLMLFSLPGSSVPKKRIFCPVGR